MKKPDYSWQQRCVDEILASVAAGNRAYLVNATPGAGKTHMTSTLAAHMLKSEAINFVVVVTPSGTICDHFVEDMGAAGVLLSRVNSGSDLTRMETEGFGLNVHGLCLTTGMLFANAKRVAKLIKLKRVLHVSDEAHHNGETMGWGKAALAVSDEAVLRLGLSGTPYRSDSERIAFLRYEEGKGMPQCNFTFEDARTAGIITDIYFRSVSGYVAVLDTSVSKKAIRYDFGDDLDDETATRRLRYALDYRSPYLKRLIKEADNELQRIRNTEQPNAAGIVFASGVKQARRIDEYLRSLGRKVCLVIEDADASKAVERFNEGDQEWLVQIRMVYEGANIPRLRVGVYATTYATESFFDQASKRLVRRLPDVDPESMPAVMFIPADEIIENLADELGDVTPHIIDENDIEGRRDERGPFDINDDGAMGELGYFEIVDGDAYLSFAMVDGKKYSADDIAAIDAYLDANFPKLAKHSTSYRLRFHNILAEAGKL